MEKWEGVIIFGENSISATVFYKRSGQYNLGDWSGYGQLEGEFSNDLLGSTIETNVGSILISKLSYDSKHVEFQGTGPINGPLATAMDIE